MFLFEFSSTSACEQSIAGLLSQPRRARRSHNYLLAQRDACHTLSNGRLLWKGTYEPAKDEEGRWYFRWRDPANPNRLD
ncbi:hypothetical protein ACNPQM_21385 [Streptomyces sp. NPDC056231]|uniref:hypothetical protein n=1 Tax=Streptomyces sp. NPDC056231 TaxID=3345755 RepID=UPI003AAC2256